MVESSNTQASPISSPASPREVVAEFLRLTVDTPDLKKAKLHLTKRSVESGSFDAAAVPAGSTYTLGGEEADELGRRNPPAPRLSQFFAEAALTGLRPHHRQNHCRS